MSDEIVAAVAGLTAKVDAMAERNTLDHQGVRATLVDLTKKVDEATKTAARNGMLMEQHTKVGDDHEKRIRTVERWQRWMAGVIAASFTFISVLGTYTFEWLKSHVGTGT